MSFHKGQLMTKRDKNLKNKKLKEIKKANIELKLYEVEDEDTGIEGIGVSFHMNRILQPAPRPRNGKGGVIYNPSSSYRNYIKKIMQELLIKEIEAGNISAFKLSDFPLKDVYVYSSLDLTITPAKSLSKKAKFYALLNKFKPCKKPDVDNVIKEFFDICNDILIKDDSYVCSSFEEKKYGYEDTTEIELLVYPNILPEGRLDKEEMEEANNMIANIVYHEDEEDTEE